MTDEMANGPSGAMDASWLIEAIHSSPSYDPDFLEGWLTAAMDDAFEQVATGSFGLWEWPDGMTGWGETFGENHSRKKVPVYRLRRKNGRTEGASDG